MTWFARGILGARVYSWRRNHKLRFLLELELSFVYYHHLSMERAGREAQGEAGHSWKLDAFFLENVCETLLMAYSVKAQHMSVVHIWWHASFSQFAVVVETSL